jgi:hypothetical protein
VTSDFLGKRRDGGEKDVAGEEQAVSPGHMDVEAPGESIRGVGEDYFRSLYPRFRMQAS